MIRALEALRVNFIDILRPGRAGGEPTAPGGHFQPADGSAVARAWVRTAWIFSPANSVILT